MQQFCFFWFERGQSALEQFYREKKRKVKQYNSVLAEFTCSDGDGLKSYYSRLVERVKPFLSAGGHLRHRKTRASLLHFLHRAICSITVPCADAGRMSSFPLSIHRLSAPKFREGRRHNKFRLQVSVAAGNNMWT